MDKVIIKCSKELDYKTEEAVRTLSTSLVNSSELKKTVVFTSYMGKEGKSFIAFNTAFIMADMGRKCLYIDANLREKQRLIYMRWEEWTTHLWHILMASVKKQNLYMQRTKLIFI